MSFDNFTDTLKEKSNITINNDLLNELEEESTKAEGESLAETEQIAD